MFRLKDRNGRDMCLGMTHEEVIAWLAAREIRSYRDLPQIWYQIQTKERDEARPRSGVLRTREFLMKDSYTLDPDAAALELSYNAHQDAYCRIFERCGVRYIVVQSDPGMMGGSGSHEFMAPSAAGEDDVALCDGVRLRRQRRAGPRGAAARRRGRGARRQEEVATPGARTIAEVSAQLKVDPALTIKSLVFMGPTGPVLALVRGDHALHERKLARALRAEARPAHPEEVQPAPRRGAGLDRAGGRPRRPRVLADESLREGRYVVGANREGYHLTGVAPGQDFACEWADLQVALPGEGCPTLRQAAPDRAGHRGRQHLQARDEVFGGARRRLPRRAAASSSPIVMGSYGIGPARIAAAAVEQRHDADGIIWPWAIAPFHVHLVPVAVKDAAQMAAAEEIYGSCGRPASTCSWTIARSAPASSSRTPTCSGSRSG